MKNWDMFYKRNQTNFFKDRHWTEREFGELANTTEVRERGEKQDLGRFTFNGRRTLKV